MTRSGHVEDMLQAKISELKSKLSSYLARVRSGDSVIILDRQTPIARLVPLEADPALVVREATSPPSALRHVKGIRLQSRVDVVDLLRRDRDDA